MHIDSPSNPLVKQVAALHERRERQAKGVMLVEGQHTVEEAIRCQLVIESLFYRDDAMLDIRLAGAKSGSETPVTPIFVSGRAMARMCTTDSPPPCMAVVRQPAWQSDLLMRTRNSLIVIGDKIQDAGNMGTLIRSAKAFGVSAIITTPNTVDPYSPKVIRSSAGLVFSQPLFMVSESVAELSKKFHAKGFQVFLTTVSGDGAVSYRHADWIKPSIIVLGNEGAGLDESMPELFGQWITIPMTPQVESLNVSVSAAILLSEAFHQRQTMPQPTPLPALRPQR